MKRMRTAEEVLKEDLTTNPDFRQHWERTALARAVALAVLHYRTDRGLSQSGLARALGLRQPHVSRLEAGEHTPSIEMLQRLASVLGLRFILEVGPAGAKPAARKRALPNGVKVLEDVTTADGSHLLVAVG